MSQKDFQKDSFVESVTTAARYFAERWWVGGGQPMLLPSPALPPPTRAGFDPHGSRQGNASFPHDRYQNAL